MGLYSMNGFLAPFIAPSPCRAMPGPPTWHVRLVVNEAHATVLSVGHMMMAALCLDWGTVSSPSRTRLTRRLRLQAVRVFLHLDMNFSMN